MTRFLLCALLAGSAPALGGCVASMAVSAASMAAQGARGTPQSNEHLRPGAVEACRAQAAQYGTVKIIDVEQARINKIIVWGTTDDGKQRRSFECDYGTKIAAFKLRVIPARP